MGEIQMLDCMNLLLLLLLGLIPRLECVVI